MVRNKKILDRLKYGLYIIIYIARWAAEAIGFAGILALHKKLVSYVQICN